MGWATAADTWPTVWASGSPDPEKVPAIFDFAGTFSIQGQSRPTAALFTAQSGLTRELLTIKFHIDPRTSFISQSNPLSIPPHKPYPVDTPSSRKLLSDSRMEPIHAPYITAILTMHFAGMSDHLSFRNVPR